MQPALKLPESAEFADTLPGAQTLHALAPVPAIEAAGRTDVGRQRSNNEDQFLVADLDRWMHVAQTSLPISAAVPWVVGARAKLLAVADGMGGHGSGEVASSVAVDTLASYVMHVMPWFPYVDTMHGDELVEQLGRSLEHCQEQLLRIAKKRGIQDHHMGTTMTLAYALWPNLYVVHVGDSRCYLYRQGALRQLTCDHTLAAQLRATGVEPGPESGAEHVLVKAIGGTPDAVAPQVSRLTMLRGDQILLCTDGLTAHVPDAQITATLASAPSCQAVCDALIDAANEAGGRDNITVIAARLG